MHSLQIAVIFFSLFLAITLTMWLLRHIVSLLMIAMCKEAMRILNSKQQEEDDTGREPAMSIGESCFAMGALALVVSMSAARELVSKDGVLVLALLYCGARILC